MKRFAKQALFYGLIFCSCSIASNLIFGIETIVQPAHAVVMENMVQQSKDGFSDYFRGGGDDLPSLEGNGAGDPEQVVYGICFWWGDGPGGPELFCPGGGSGGYPPVHVPLKCDEGHKVIDVLFAVTRQACDELTGGGSGSCNETIARENILQDIYTAVTITNGMFTRSKAEMQIQVATDPNVTTPKALVVFLTEEGDVDESDTMSENVSEMIETSNRWSRIMSEETGIRDTVGADLVTIITSSATDDFFYSRKFTYYSLQGLIDRMEAVNAVRVDTLVDYYFPRAIACNIGAGQEDTAESNCGFFENSRAYEDPGIPFKTVMHSEVGNPIVSFFSNPDVTYSGVPTGDDSHNNALAFSKISGCVRDHRGANRTNYLENSSFDDDSTMDYYPDYDRDDNEPDNDYPNGWARSSPEELNGTKVHILDYSKGYGDNISLKHQELDGTLHRVYDFENTEVCSLSEVPSSACRQEEGYDILSKRVRVRVRGYVETELSAGISAVVVEGFSYPGSCIGEDCDDDDRRWTGMFEDVWQEMAFSGDTDWKRIEYDVILLPDTHIVKVLPYTLRGDPGLFRDDCCEAYPPGHEDSCEELGLDRLEEPAHLCPVGNAWFDDFSLEVIEVLD